MSRSVFKSHCPEGRKDIDAKAFTTICRDCRLIDHTFTDTDSNVVFATVTRGRTRMDLPSFGSAMKFVAKAKGVDVCVLRRMLADPSGGAEGPACAPVASDPHIVASSRCTEAPDKPSPRAARRPIARSASRDAAVGLTGKGQRHNDLIEQGFKVFCGAQPLMDKGGFATFCRSTHLVNESGLVDRDFDLIFDKIVAVGQMGMDLPQFRAALTHLLQSDTTFGCAQDHASPARNAFSMGGPVARRGQEPSSWHTKTFATRFNDNSVAHKARMCTEMLQTEDKIVDLHCSGAALSVLADLDLPACQETGSELEEMNFSQRNRCRKGLKDNDDTCPSMWCWSDVAPSCSTTASPASSRSSSPSR